MTTTTALPTTAAAAIRAAIADAPNADALYDIMDELQALASAAEDRAIDIEEEPVEEDESLAWLDELHADADAHHVAVHELLLAELQ